LSIDRGLALMALGLLLIAGSALWVARAAEGPDGPARTFSERRSYNQVKESLHEVFPRAAGLGLAGLALTLLGARLRARSRP